MQTGRSSRNVVEMSSSGARRIGRTDNVAETSRSEWELSKNLLELSRNVSQTL